MYKNPQSKGKNVQNKGANNIQQIYIFTKNIYKKKVIKIS